MGSFVELRIFDHILLCIPGSYIAPNLLVKFYIISVELFTIVGYHNTFFHHNDTIETSSKIVSKQYFILE